MFFSRQMLPIVFQSINYKIKERQSDFGGNATNILGLKRFSLKIRDIEKNCLSSLGVPTSESRAPSGWEPGASNPFCLLSRSWSHYI